MDKDRKQYEKTQQLHAKEVEKALEIIEVACLIIEDAEQRVQELTDRRLKNIIAKHAEKYGQFDTDNMIREAHDYETFAERLLIAIDEKLNPEEDEQ